MDTPVCSVPVFERPPVKRLCFDASPGTPIDSFDRDVKLVLDDQSLASHVRSVLATLIEDRKFLHSVLRRNNELLDEISVLRAENAELKKALENCGAAPLKQPSQPPRSLPSPHPPLIVHSDEAYDEKERRRCAVLIGLPESGADIPSVRVAEDFRARSWSRLEFNQTLEDLELVREMTDHI
ncbi:hypothetical protein Q1695_005089 [Nippostrongylus brasiliensis]|nr:hypothetical protein Q1695_005089 [Nippostrongylus brasiliensis]